QVERLVALDRDRRGQPEAARGVDVDAVRAERDVRDAVGTGAVRDGRAADLPQRDSSVRNRYVTFHGPHDARDGAGRSGRGRRCAESQSGHPEKGAEEWGDQERALSTGSSRGAVVEGVDGHGSAPSLLPMYGTRSALRSHSKPPRRKRPE